MFWHLYTKKDKENNISHNYNGSFFKFWPVRDQNPATLYRGISVQDKLLGTACTNERRPSGDSESGQLFQGQIEDNKIYWFRLSRHFTTHTNLAKPHPV